MSHSAPPRTIDVHAHYLASDLVDALEQRGEMPRIVREEDGSRNILYGPGSGHVLYEEMVDIEAQLELMARDGIDFAVINANVPGVDWFSPADGITVAAGVNDELADLTKQHADRLVAMALLPMQAPQAAAEELRRAVANGLRGGMVFSNIAGKQLDLAVNEPVFAAAAELRVPILIHPTVPLSGAGMDAYALVPTVGFLVDTTVATMRLILGGIFERYPELDLILPHTGALLPQLAGRIDVEAARMPGGMGELSTPPSEQIARLYTDCVCAWPPALHSCIELLGADRIMFGTDFPFWSREEAHTTLVSSKLEPAVETAIRRGTAERLFKIAAEATTSAGS